MYSYFFENQKVIKCLNLQPFPFLHIYGGALVHPTIISPLQSCHLIGIPTSIGRKRTLLSAQKKSMRKVKNMWFRYFRALWREQAATGSLSYLEGAEGCRDVRCGEEGRFTSHSGKRLRRWQPSTLPSLCRGNTRFLSKWVRIVCACKKVK